MDSNYRPQCEWARRFRTTGPAAIAVFEVALQRGTLPLAREGNGSTRVMAGVNSPQALREQLAHPPAIRGTASGAVPRTGRIAYRNAQAERRRRARNQGYRWLRVAGSFSRPDPRPAACADAA